MVKHNRAGAIIYVLCALFRLMYHVSFGTALQMRVIFFFFGGGFWFHGKIDVRQASSSTVLFGSAKP